MKDTYHLTEATLTHPDGTKVVLQAGHVIRPFNGPGEPFMDMIVLGFSEDGNAKVARPYCYVSGAGTTGPTVLTGHEELTVSLSKLGQLEVRPLDNFARTLGVR